MDDDRILTVAEAADFLGVTPKTLNNWRYSGRTLYDHGPKWVVYRNTGRFWGYQLKALKEYIGEQAIERERP